MIQYIPMQHIYNFKKLVSIIFFKIQQDRGLNINNRGKTIASFNSFTNSAPIFTLNQTS